ncbi:hypothetical protein B0O80DRAFT_449551 [Mortierella sp. GBAus27b]|nr:hypothetical protein B0O80DRAFT_449551 [Mortierella sp. GBAus27b]
MKGDQATISLLPPRHPLSPCTPISPLASFNPQPEAVLLPTLSVIDVCPASPAVSSYSMMPSPLSPFGHTVDALSQCLLNIENQMRRPSFLMNGTTSAFGSLLVSDSIAFPDDKHDSQERLLAELSLTVGTIEPPSAIPNGVVEPRGDGQGSISEVDRIVWNEAWKRRRMKTEETEAEEMEQVDPVSPTMSTPSSSRSSTALSSPSSPSSPTNSSLTTSADIETSPRPCIHPSIEQCQGTSKKQKQTRKLFSLPTSSSTSLSPPAAPPIASSPTKDANPELWESEGLKWGDRFHTLVHNFQVSAGKHSKKLTEMLPKNPWSKRSRSRTQSSIDRG